MNSKELLDFILKNQGDYERCLYTIESELLLRQIHTLATNDRKYERIDKEYPIVRLTTDESKVEGCKCRTSDKGERGCY